MITFTTSGSFDRFERSLQKMSDVRNIQGVLQAVGREGAAALASATPADSGLAANSWTYEVKVSRGSYSVTWMNTDVESGFPVAIMLNYGYGTGTGGYVRGRNYIKPAIRPVFDSFADRVWKAVTSA